VLTNGNTVAVTGGEMELEQRWPQRFSAEAARKIIDTNIDAAAAEKMAGAIGGEWARVEVADEAQVRRLAEQSRDIDLFWPNAVEVSRR
jgi:hypothetical protein